MNLKGSEILNPTVFQKKVREELLAGKSLLVIAPTGLGKTFAVTGDLETHHQRTIYAVPLRALGGSIKESIQGLHRGGEQLNVALHHGASLESTLFGEEVVVTTYDQLVCAVPGLPLSLPLKAGHAIAGATFMSRLILDEVHLAWGISKQALAILFGILELRQRFSLQTVLMTATLPLGVAHRIADEFDLGLMVVSENDFNEGLSPIGAGRYIITDDEGLRLRESDRYVTIDPLELKTSTDMDKKMLNLEPLLQGLMQSSDKRIYFANTVERIQQVYDRLVERGLDKDRIVVLHNRMPAQRRTEIEKNVIKEWFGEGTPELDMVLLTNQVAEAGLDISAPFVISDPAPVDVLIQRAGRCARWFRNGKVKGQFLVLKPQSKQQLKDLYLPYDFGMVQKALEVLPSGRLSWSIERAWIEEAWGGGPKEAKNRLETLINDAMFALNLFDRAAQNKRPGEIASVFREVLSIEVAVDETSADRVAEQSDCLAKEMWPDTCSMSLAQARYKLRDFQRSGGVAKVIRSVQDETLIIDPDYLQLGDILILPPSYAYLHDKKGLCFGVNESDDRILSTWKPIEEKHLDERERSSQYQSLYDHSAGVMHKTYARFTTPGDYRNAMLRILTGVYDLGDDSETFVDVIAQISAIAAALHDFGKTDADWQERVRLQCPECPEGLIGRTPRIGGRAVGIPHTPPAYSAILKVGHTLLGAEGMVDHLVRAIALAAVRHHSSFVNPSLQKRQLKPMAQTKRFVEQILIDANLLSEIAVEDIIDAAKEVPSHGEVPLLLPNNRLFPIYALVGRAILMSDREDAAGGKELEQWRSSI